jgi:hypothetical protein
LSPEQTTPRNNPLWWAELEIISTESTWNVDPHQRVG